jgi:hypothetical protein
MAKDKSIYFNWKFLPNKEHRKTPDSRDYDCDNLFQLLEWRQELRLWFLNWRNVWYTYRYLLNFYPYLGLVVLLLTGSWTWGLSTLLMYVPMRLYLDKKISFLDQLEILMPGIIDSKLIPVFGNLPEFNQA